MCFRSLITTVLTTDHNSVGHGVLTIARLAHPLQEPGHVFTNIVLRAPVNYRLIEVASFLGVRSSVCCISGQTN